MYQPVELLQDTKARLIVEGWARVAQEYTPRPLTTLERHQMERAELVERQAQETPFVLGELIGGQ
jgi:hypothetical protein